MTDRQTGFTDELRLEGLPNGWVVGRFRALEAIRVAHLVTTRQGPDVHQIRQDPATAGRQIAQVLGFEDAAFLEQVHGGDALVCERGGCAGCADGLVTPARGLVLMGRSADCPIVLIADRRGRAAGFAHASWRATVAGIVPAVVRRMIDMGCDPADLVACIGPSAGPECYEVGDEVRGAALDGIGPHAAAFFQSSSAGKYCLDLWRANACALARAGIPSRFIHVAGICTLCRDDLFPSYRREGDTAGRFAAVIGWPCSL
ncbi:MAG: polyphenol oxidase family protein [Sedimentisphaerales bacterium]|nr:polyphenol oxidase family protein [Sedimentisphaerales bacterium]